ncbi:MAG TPA: bifunctional diguanylate cyclase/phosphodiesterase, partial [Acidimicrobiales bacterium]|nr:bifunctional diguanylate cyclase/phosphodiesterase [Acidimicrobiales bacterium]
GGERFREQAEVQLRHQAGRDALTGLPNRTLVRDRAQQMLLRSQRDHHLIGAFFVDLDNFKILNDTLGQEAGDELLKSVAARFVSVLRASDTVGRLEGDEFVILAEGVSLSAGPELLAERLLEALQEPFRIEGWVDIPLSLSASIGIATNDRDAPHDLLRDADIALCQAKARGKNCFVQFTPEMKTVAMERLELEMDLRTALEENQFFLLYQPIFDLDSVNVCGVEALLRWRHPARGIVEPDAVIPVLEETGLIIPVGMRVLKQACWQAAAWHRLGHHLTMSVNVSMCQLETDEFVDQVRETLSATALRPSSLIVEVTETSLMQATDAMTRQLRKLKELGVLIAVDDFGTGGSSLDHLREFPIDALKIDRSFIAAMADSPGAVSFIRMLMHIGRTLGVETLAEGIEQGWQLETLQHEQCEFGQGFLFSQPIAPEALEAILSLEALLS